MATRVFAEPSATTRSLTSLSPFTLLQHKGPLRLEADIRAWLQKVFNLASGGKPIGDHVLQCHNHEENPCKPVILVANTLMAPIMAYLENRDKETNLLTAVTMLNDYHEIDRKLEAKHSKLRIVRACSILGGAGLGCVAGAWVYGSTTLSSPPFPCLACTHRTIDNVEHRGNDDMLSAMIGKGTSTTVPTVNGSSSSSSSRAESAVLGLVLGASVGGLIGSLFW